MRLLDPGRLALAFQVHVTHYYAWFFLSTNSHFVLLLKMSTRVRLLVVQCNLEYYKVGTSC